MLTSARHLSLRCDSTRRRAVASGRAELRLACAISLPTFRRIRSSSGVPRESGQHLPPCPVSTSDTPFLATLLMTEMLQAEMIL